jgi:hypothetical protein
MKKYKTVKYYNRTIEFKEWFSSGYIEYNNWYNSTWFIQYDNWKIAFDNYFWEKTYLKLCWIIKKSARKYNIDTIIF